MYRVLERLAQGLAKLMAYAGGLALLGLVVMSVISILGRAGQTLGLPLTSLPGDTEWVELGTGFAVFAFLPWCTLSRGHATVDLFQPLFGRIGNRLLDLIADILIFALAALLTWRLWAGMIDKTHGYAETTTILKIEIWKGYAAALTGAVVFVLVAAFCVLRAARALSQPEPQAPRTDLPA